jgi:hypothetical protein
MSRRASSRTVFLFRSITSARAMLTATVWSCWCGGSARPCHHTSKTSGRAAISGFRKSLSAALGLPTRAFDTHHARTSPRDPTVAGRSNGLARVGQHRIDGPLSRHEIRLLVATRLALERHRVCHLLPTLRATAGPSSAKPSAWPGAADGRELVMVGSRQQPGLTERTLARSEPGADAPHVTHRLTARQVSALFRLRPSWEAGPRPDLPALRPLHSTPRPPKQAPPSSRSVRSAGRKLARQSRTARAHLTHALGQLRCRAPLRRRCVVAVRQDRLGRRYWPTAFGRPSWSETSPSGCGPAAGPHPLASAARTPYWPSARTSALTAKTQNHWLALARRRLVAVTQSPADPAQVATGAAAGLARTTGAAYGARDRRCGSHCAPVAAPCDPGRHTTNIVRSFPRSSVTPLF